MTTCTLTWTFMSVEILITTPITSRRLSFIITRNVWPWCLRPAHTTLVVMELQPSHFKNRFSVCFLLQLLLLGRTVLWGFQAPSHGKGSWHDPITVIKIPLRRMELHPKFPGYRHCKVWWNIFMFLSHHYGKKKKHNDEDLSLDDNDSWHDKCPDPLQDGLVDSLHVHYITTSALFICILRNSSC